MSEVKIIDCPKCSKSQGVELTFPDEQFDITRVTWKKCIHCGIWMLIKYKNKEYCAKYPK